MLLWDPHGGAGGVLQAPRVTLFRKPRPEDTGRPMGLRFEFLPAPRVGFSVCICVYE